MVRAGCVFVAGIHPSTTWTSGSFESVRWNACVHRLDLGLYSHPKEFWGNGVWTHVNSKGKIPSTGKCPQRRIEPAMLWTASPSTTNWAIPAPPVHVDDDCCCRTIADHCFVVSSCCRFPVCVVVDCCCHSWYHSWPPFCCLQPEGHLLEDRFKSFQMRNIMEPRVKVKWVLAADYGL